MESRTVIGQQAPASAKAGCEGTTPSLIKARRLINDGVALVEIFIRDGLKAKSVVCFYAIRVVPFHQHATLFLGNNSGDLLRS